MSKRFVKRNLIILLATTVMVLTAADAALALLQLGDPAPPLEVMTWVQGKPADLATGRKTAIHVIEFWAPDCPHCRDSVPLLNALQQTHDRQVVVIGITDADPEQIRTFLSEAEEPITYRIAVDADDKTKIAYMEGFDVSGIPHVFVMDRRGRIAWEGHPSDGLAEAIGRMIAGTYDLEKQALLATADKLLGVYAYLAERTRETDLLGQIGERIMICARRDAALLHRMAREIAFNESIANPDLALALRAVERAYRIDSESDPELVKTRENILQRLGRKATGQSDAPPPAAREGESSRD